MELVCIVCPNGCRMRAVKGSNGFLIEGNRCPRGAAFAQSELTCPMRSLTTTVATTLPGIPVAPVRTAGEVPKAMLPKVLAACNAYTLTHPVRCGEVLIPDIAKTGCSLIATRTLGGDKP